MGVQASTPNLVRLLLVHDVIPEIFGWDMSTGEWLEKSNAVSEASSVVAVSQYTAKAFLRIYPQPTSKATGDAVGRDRYRAAAATTPRPVWVAHNGVDTAIFYPRTAAADDNRNGNGNDDRAGTNVSERFRRLAGLNPETPYVMIVGARHGFKNARAAYRALGLAVAPTATATATAFPAHDTLALVLVGGGPVQPEELDLLAEVGVWSHIGIGSGISTSSSAAGAAAEEAGAAGASVAGGRKVAAIDDSVLAEGYSGAAALLHLSLAEGFGLTVLEAFACGCPVVASDIPPVREIAGLPELDEGATQEAAAKERGDTSAAPEAEAGAATPPSLSPWNGIDSRRKPQAGAGAGRGRYDGASSSLEGGLVLVENPASATQVWRAVRAVAAMGPERRAAASEALVRRAKVFNSWQPLADTLIKAAVE